MATPHHCLFFCFTPVQAPVRSHNPGKLRHNCCYKSSHGTQTQTATFYCIL